MWIYKYDFIFPFIKHKTFKLASMEDLLTKVKECKISKKIL